MKKLISTMMQHLVKDRQPRFRDRRAHYASSAFTDLRDQYWSITGEKRTNPTDFVGKMKMLVGSAVEAQLVKELFGDLHWYGIHLVGTQVQVGGSNPAWDGNMDVMLYDKDSKENYVVEIKTKSGYGADLLYKELSPSKEYLAQLGLYLRDLSSKEGGATKGCLFYVLLSDNHFGEVLKFDCHYDKVMDAVYCNSVEGSTLSFTPLEIKLDMQEVLQRYSKVDNAVAEGVIPKPEYQYKYPVDAESLKSVSDSKLLKMLKGELVNGDWQPKYSGYLDLALQTDKQDRGYSEAEMFLIRKEYRTRHPKSKY